MSIRFDNQVAIVTGAGNGLGKAHALFLAERGAKVVINDLGGSRDGSGQSSEAAQAVVKLIEERGGEAMAHDANVADFTEVQDMVQQTMARWGRVDILINNAGILRDKTFSKMSLDDFRLVMDVHLMGSVNCTKAVWDIMREQSYGRIVMTTSGSGMYGNFGQANYGAAKMAVLGLMNTLVIEGAKHNIKVNALAPAAGTRMTEELIPKEMFELMTPEVVAAGVMTLCAEDAPNRQILCAGAGGFASTHLYETQGTYIAPDQLTPEAVQANTEAIYAREGEKEMQAASEQSMKFALQAMQHHGIELPNS
ncbi:SDR family NAD(P)-dependent oxidoreductase [Maricurvus nonylphenolicus]|uniref:SDR family NAD(P)-dependent oxidoreductase n=1 Tax=Maricurvus nonylphenolicus TaxID=1008307 RepID=UPI0036F3D22F